MTTLVTIVESNGERKKFLAFEKKERKSRDFIQWAKKYTNKKFLNCIYVRGSK